MCRYVLFILFFFPRTSFWGVNFLCLICWKCKLYLSKPIYISSWLLVFSANFAFCFIFCWHTCYPWEGKYLNILLAQIHKRGLDLVHGLTASYNVMFEHQLNFAFHNGWLNLICGLTIVIWCQIFVLLMRLV